MVSCLVFNPHIFIIVHGTGHVCVCLSICLGTYVWGGLYRSDTPDRSLNMCMTDNTAHCSLVQLTWGKLLRLFSYLLFFISLICYIMMLSDSFMIYKCHYF